MVISDDEARSLRDWVTSFEDTPDPNPMAQAAYIQGVTDLQAYEKATQLSGRVPYEVNPSFGRETIQRLQRSLREPADDLDPEQSRAATRMAYLSLRFKKPLQEVETNLPAFEQAISQLHGGVDAAAAIEQDMTASLGRMDAADVALHAAHVAAARGLDLAGALEHWQEVRRTDTPAPEPVGQEDLTSLFTIAFTQAGAQYEQKRGRYESLRGAVEVLTKKADVLDTRQLFEAAAQLTAMDPQEQYLALTYLDANAQGQKSLAESFLGRMNELVRGAAKLTPGEIHAQAVSVMRTVMDGGPLAVSELVAGDPVVRVATGTAGAFFSGYPLWRLATPQERAERYEDAYYAAQFAEAMLQIEGVVKRKTSPSSVVEDPSLRAVIEQIAFGGAATAADAAFFIGAGALGRGMGGITGTSKTVMGTAYALRATLPAMQAEHYAQLRAAGLEARDAYVVAESSGAMAATIDVFADALVLGQLPGVSKMLAKLPQLKGRPALVTAGALGAEVATEMAQNLTSSMVQEAYGALGADLPDVDWTKQVKETIRQAPDIALAVLPLVLFGAGREAYVQDRVRRTIEEKATFLQDMGVSEADAKAIINAASIEERRAAINKAVASIEAMAAQQENKDSRPARPMAPMSETTSEAAAAAVEAEVRDGTVLRPAAGAGVRGYGVELPGGGAHVTPDRAAGQSALDAMAETGSELPEGDQARAESFRAAPLHLRMPNAATTVVGGAKPVADPVSSVEVMARLTRIMQRFQPKGTFHVGRLGRGNKKKQSLGWYSPRQRLIRIKTSHDVTTAAHEVGHLLHDALYDGPGQLAKALANTPAREELRTLGKSLYAMEPGKDGWISEGFAEFIRLRLSDPEAAAKAAPDMTERFGERLAGDRQLSTLLTEAQQALTTYLRQGARNRAAANMGPNPDARNLKEKGRAAADAFERTFLDSAAAIHNMVGEYQTFVQRHGRRKGKGKAPDPSLTLTARRMSADSIVAYMANTRMLDFNGNRTEVKPLQAAFNAVGKKKTHDFLLYLWAKRALAVWSTDRNPGMDKADAVALVEELESPSFSAAAQIVYDWNSGVLDYAAGASSDLAQTVEKIRQGDPGFYIPLFRVFQSFDQRYRSRVSAARGSLAKHMRGSGRPIEDPVESMLKQARAIVEATHQRVILEQVILLQEHEPMLSGYVAKVPADMVPALSVSLKEVFAKLETLSGAELDGTGLDYEVMTFFRPAVQPRPTDHPIIPMTLDGQLQWFEVDVGLYDALRTADLANFGWVGRVLLSGPAKLFRLGTTSLSARFSLVTNPSRDLRTLWLQSASTKSQAELTKFYMEALKDLFLHAVTRGKYTTPWLDLFMRLGVEMAQPLAQDRPTLKTAARRVKNGGKFDPFEWTDALDLYLSVLQFPESAARLAELRAVAEDMGYDGKQPLTAEVAFRLARAAKQVTTDFTAAGTLARQINQAVPFFNASIQGNVSFVRRMRQNPAQTVVRGIYGTALALANWYQNRDEPWWREMTYADRYLFTYVQVGNEVLRIPRNFEVDGLFMAFPEMLVDSWYADEPEQALQWVRKWVGGVTQMDFGDNWLPVPPLPVLGKLGLEQAANRNFFFNQPIVPRGEETLPAAEQFGPYTTTISIEIGRLLDVSPRRIDHIIRSLGGGVAMDVASLLGRGEGVRAEREFELANVPVLGALFKRGGEMPVNPESVNRLYEVFADMVEVQRSRRLDETQEQRQARLLVADALRAVQALNAVQQVEVTRDERHAIQEMRIRIAKDALEAVESGHLDRTAFRQAARAAEAKEKAATEPDTGEVDSGDEE